MQIQNLHLQLCLKIKQILQLHKLLGVDTNHNSGNTDSVRFTGQITFHSSQTFTIAGNAGGGLYEAAPGTATLNQVASIDIRTVAGAVDALKVIDRALDRVHMERAKFGAIMSRMNVVIDNLTNVSTNQKTSRSRITDANFASESARLGKISNSSTIWNEYDFSSITNNAKCFNFISVN